MDYHTKNESLELSQFKSNLKCFGTSEVRDEQNPPWFLARKLEQTKTRRGVSRPKSGVDKTLSGLSRHKLTQNPLRKKRPEHDSYQKNTQIHPPPPHHTRACDLQDFAMRF